MKKIILFIAIVIWTFSSFGQNVKINDLNIPTSPAFVLMDKSPASIEKPSNPKALSISLINVWQNNGAIEFTPYWFKDRPAYTFEDDLKNKSPILQTFAISAATAKEDSFTNISVGFRTQLFRSYSKEIKIKVEAKKTEIVNLLSVEDPSLIDLDAVNEAKKELNDLQSRSALNIEVAGAYMGNSSAATKLSSSKAGIWLNVKYSPPPSIIPLDFVFLARYSKATHKASLGSDSTFFDYGLNLSYQNKDFDLQIEYVSRRDFNIKKNYDRFAFVSNYQITPGIILVASAGKDFKSVSNIFGLFGIKFGLSKSVATLQ